MVAIKTGHFPAELSGIADSGETPISVNQAAYALAKAQSHHDAVAIMQTIPTAIYAALKAHINARPNLFLPEVRSAVARIMDAPKMSAAEALFT
jgi:hypothetical protein